MNKNNIDLIIKNILNEDDYKRFKTIESKPIDNKIYINKEYIMEVTSKMKETSFRNIIFQIIKSNELVNNYIEDQIAIISMNFIKTVYEYIVNQVTEIKNIKINISYIMLVLFNKLNYHFEESKTKFIMNIILKIIINSDIIITKGYVKNEGKWNSIWQMCMEEEDVSTILSLNIIQTKEYKNVYKNKPCKWVMRSKSEVVYGEYQDLDNLNENIDFVSASKIFKENWLGNYTNKEYVQGINVQQCQGYKIDIDLFNIIAEKYYKTFESMSNTYVNCELNYDEYRKYKKIELHEEEKKDIFKKVKSIIKNPKNINLDKSVISLLIENNVNSIKIKYKKLSNSIDNEIDQFILQKKKNDVEYHTCALMVLDFLKNYVKNDLIYHKMSIDFRGRVVIKSIFNYIASKCIRYLMYLPDNINSKELFDAHYNKHNFQAMKTYIEMSEMSMFYIARQIKKKVYTIKEGIQIYNEIFKSTNSIEDLKITPYNAPNLIKIYKYGAFATVSIDATASVCQIMSSLFKDEKMMLYTNVISYKSEDIYDYIIEKIKIAVEDSMLINFLTERKIIKYTCMTYLYGSNAPNIADELKSMYKINLCTKDLIRVCSTIIKCFKINFSFITDVKKAISAYIDLIDVYKEFNFKILDKELSYNTVDKKEIKFRIKTSEVLSYIYKLAEKRIYVFDKCVDINKIKDIQLKKYINNILKKKENKINNTPVFEYYSFDKIKDAIKNEHNLVKNVILSINSLLKKTFYINDKIENKYVNYEDKNSSLRKNIKYLDEFMEKYKDIILFNISFKTEDKEKISFTKKKKSCLVNIIHSLDSQICYKIVNELKKENIAIKTIHDCFTIKLYNYEKVLKSYNKKLNMIYDTSIFDIIYDLKEISNRDIPKEVTINYINCNKKEITQKYIRLYNNKNLNKKTSIYKKKDININIEKYIKDLFENIDSFVIENINKDILLKKKNILKRSLINIKRFNNENKNFKFNSHYTLQPE